MVVDAEPPAATVTTAVNVPAAVGVPVIRPEEALIESPAGRPVADQLYAPDPPVAVIGSDTAVPTRPPWLPGLLTVRAPLGVQVGSPACAGTLMASQDALTAS